MDEDRYRIIITSLEGAQRQELAAELAQLAGKTPEHMLSRMERLPWLLGRRLPKAHAERLRELVTRHGGQARMQPEAASPRSAKTPESPPRRPPRDSIPSLGFRQRTLWCFRMAMKNKGLLLGVWLLMALILGVSMTGMMLLFAGALAGGLAGLAANMNQPGQWWAMLASPAFQALLTSPLLMGALIFPVVMTLALGWQQAALLLTPASWFAAGSAPGFRKLARDAWLRAPDVASTFALVSLLPMLAANAGTALARLLPAGGWAVGTMTAILALFLFVALALSLPAAAMEDIGPMEAIRRGWSLGRNRRLALLGNAVGFVIVLALLAILISLTIGLLAAGLGLASREIAGIVTSALAVLLYFSLAVLGGSAASFLPAFLYFEARMQTDGWVPPWRVAPHPDWPTATGANEQTLSRRGAAWRDFLLVNLATLGPLATLAWLAPMPKLGAALPSSNVAGVMQPARPNPDRTAGEHPGGPFTLHMGAFFKSDQDPSFWLDVETSARPSGEVSLRILSITDEQGRDIHAADNTFERNPFFSTLRWSRAPDGNGVVAHRTVHLLPGVGQSDIALIRGELVLAGQRLPFTLRPDARARLIPRGAKTGKRQTMRALTSKSRKWTRAS